MFDNGELRNQKSSLDKRPEPIFRYKHYTKSGEKTNSKMKNQYILQRRDGWVVEARGVVSVYDCLGHGEEVKLVVGCVI